MIDADFAANLFHFGPSNHDQPVWSGTGTFSPWNNDGHHFGRPEPDGHVPQTTPFTCAVVSQEMILHQFGINVSEAQLVYDATVHGWLTDHGTNALDAGKLLDFYGVHTHSHYGANVENLAAELAQGHKVVVGVSSSNLWGPNFPFANWLHPAGADHAVVVTGLDMSDPAHPQVLINDPGDPHHGAAHAYPLNHFLRAWSESGRMYVATDDAPPHLVDHPVQGMNFHADTGMYMDQAFWVDAIFTAVGVCADALIRHLLEGVLPDVSPTDMAGHTLDHLNESQRNHLFISI